jgi:hypothetical protein
MKTFLAVMLLSCVSFTQDVAATAKAKAACGPENISFDADTLYDSHPSATVAQGKALVYVISQDLAACVGCGTVARVGMDGTWAGAANLGSYMSFTVEPGEHHLCTNWQSRFAGRKKPVGLTSLAAEAGKAYYFRMRLVASSNQTFIDLDLVNADEGQYLVASSPMSESHPKKP